MPISYRRWPGSRPPEARQEAQSNTPTIILISYSLTCLLLETRALI